MDNKIVTARFATDDNYVNVYDVYQWDYGQVLRIEGLKLPNMVEIHFSLQETSGEAKTRIGVTKDGVTDVVIPDSFLENSGIGDNYKIFAWVYVADKDSGSTEYKITIHIKARAKPEISHGGQDGEVFQEAVEAVRDAAKRAAESEKQAERWAVGRVDVPGAETDNSKFYAEESKKNARQTTKDKEAVEELVKKTENIGQLAEEVKVNAQKASESAKNAETSATNASVSEKNAKTSESNASTSETNAKASETNAKASEQAVEKSKQTVDKTVADFGQAVTNASAALKSEKDAHVKAITTAGTTETKRVTDEGTKQVQTVQSTGAQETEKVTAEGTKQVGLVKTEGEKHLAAVQTAAQEIVADREQIQKNKTDIADLRQNKADAIVESVSGTLLNVKDSANAFFEDFFMYGKTVQDGTPTPDAPVEIVNTGRLNSDTGKYEIDVKITGKNLIDEKEIYKTNLNYFISDKRYGGKGINLKAGTSYIFSVNKNVNGMYIHSYSDTPEELTKVYGQQKLTYTPKSDVKVQLLIYREKKIIEGTTAQLEEGEVATAYEPYKEPQTIAISLDRPLTKWDRLEKREGVWGIVRKGKKITVTGNEAFSVPDHTRPWLYYCYFDDEFYVGSTRESIENIACNYFESNSQGWVEAKDCILGNITSIIVSLKNYVNLETFKNTLKEKYNTGKPVEIYATLAKETWEPLSEEMQKILNALHTNYPTTVVTNSEDTEMQLTYIADTKNYHLGREEILQKQILEIQNALISQKISGGGIKVTNSAKLPIVKLSVFGKSEQNGVPTVENPIPIVSAGESGNIEVKITGKNLINVSEDAISSNYDAGSYTIKNGVIAFNTANNWGGDYLYFNDIDVSKNKELVFQMEATLPEEQDTEEKGAKILFKAYNKLGEEIKDSESAISNDTWKMAYNNHYKGLIYYRRGSNISIKFSSVVAKIKVGVCFLDVIERKAVTIRDYQVEYGATSTAYEPYKEQAITLQTPNGLLGLKVNSGGNYTDSNGQQWICDEIDLARGKYVQRVKKEKVPHDIHWNIQAAGGYVLAHVSTVAKDGVTTQNEEATWMSNFGDSSATWRNGFCFGKSGVFWIVPYKNSGEITSEDVNNWLKEHQVEVVYPLKTPVEYNLPPETISAFKQLHTNYPTTLVSNNADAGMELTYTVDTQSYIDGKIATLSKAIL